MKVVVLGLGYTGQTFLRHLEPGVTAVATRRSVQPPGATGLQHPRHDPPGRLEPLLRAFPGEETALEADLTEADAVLVSVPPDPALPAPHDPVLAAFGTVLARAPKLRWLGYLSTIGVYGDHDGAWVDETTTSTPSSRRSRARLEAENAWLALAKQGVPVHVFRLAGIYGPGRSAFDKLKDGTARRVVKPSQVFNRIHVDDIARTLLASMAKPRPGATYNVTDDEPTPPEDVIAEAAHLLGMEPPPEVPFDATDMSPMAASFWGETKRVSNRLIRDELGVRLGCPTYREGLRSILAAAPETNPPER